MKYMLFGMILVVLAISLILGNQQVFADQQGFAVVGQTTFVVPFNIENGYLVNLYLDFQSTSIIMEIDPLEDGEVNIEIPRTLLDAKNGGQDIDFFILVDGTQETYTEFKTSEYRNLDFSVPKGSYEVEIVGTEFLLGHTVYPLGVIIESGSGTPGCENYGGCYLPKSGLFTAGSSVSFVNDDNVEHTVTSGYPGSGHDGIFDSGLMNPGDTWTLTVPSEGLYSYYCLVHPWMVGDIFSQSANGIPNISWSKSVYSTNDLPEVTLMDPNQDPNWIDQREIIMYVVSDPDNIITKLITETGTNTGVFKFTSPVSVGSGTSNQASDFAAGFYTIIDFSPYYYEDIMTIISAPPPPTDSDGDGIADVNDQCPSQAEDYNGYLDTDGCPDTPPSKGTTSTIQADRSTVLIGSDVVITVVDSDSNNSGIIDSIRLDTTTRVLVNGIYAGTLADLDPNPLDLRETSKSSGLFQVVVEISSKIGGTTLSDGDQINVQYRDPDATGGWVSIKLDVMSLPVTPGTGNPPNIVTSSNIYHNDPTKPVYYSLKIVDDRDGIIPSKNAVCSPPDGSIFTTSKLVSCYVFDSDGNKGTGSFDVIIPPPQTSQIPQWVKTTAEWYCDNQVTESAFKRALEYLIQTGVINVSVTSSGSSSSQPIPDWVKNNACWWANNQISDSDFISAIEYLINQGIIVV